MFTFQIALIFFYFTGKENPIAAPASDDILVTSKSRVVLRPDCEPIIVLIHW